MKAKYPVNVIVYFFSILFLFGCIEVSYRPDITPKNVSESAVWVGGPDGGVYIDLESTEEKQYYNLTVYAQVTGSILYKGKLKSENILDSFNTRDSSAYSFWDGDNLVLSNGEILKAVKLDKK